MIRMRNLQAEIPRVLKARHRRLEESPVVAPAKLVPRHRGPPVGRAEGPVHPVPGPGVVAAAGGDVVFADRVGVVEGDFHSTPSVPPLQGGWGMVEIGKG